jgi:AhpD family alkylhydroperoxidase
MAGMHLDNGSSPASSAPRIAPGGREEIGFVNHAIARVLGLATGGRPPNVMTTLGRHRGLFRKWLRFASGLMPGGRLPRAESELAILRVAHNCECAYEWHHHERLARTAGLSAEQVERVREGHAAPGWSQRHELVLRTADELHAERTISGELWAQLSAVFSEVELIELCMLIGHYEMLAMTLNALRVQPDPLPDGPPPRAIRAVQAFVERRAASGAGGS